MEDTLLRHPLCLGVLPGAAAAVVAALGFPALTQVSSRALSGAPARALSEFLQLLFIMQELAERSPCSGSIRWEEYDHLEACEQ